MPGPAPKRVRLARRERRELKRLVRRGRAPHWLVVRAKMILSLSRGTAVAATARELGCVERNVRKWRTRWLARPEIQTLDDGERPGRPPRIGVDVRCNLVAIACEQPDGILTPLRNLWTQQTLADALRARTGFALSRSSVQRILCTRGLRPHRVRQWLHSPDPDFAKKARRVCRLYKRPPRDGVVVSIDEKPLQVLARRHGDHVGPDGFVRREFEYVRHGVRCLLAAFDIRTGRVIGEVVTRRTGDALVSFLERVALAFPRKKVWVVWDNLNTHYDGNDERWTKFNERHDRRFRFVYTPFHASWVNQVEIWFSILQRRVIRHGDFGHVNELVRDVMAFVRYWNRFEAHPFRWTFSGDFVQTPVRAAA